MIHHFLIITWFTLKKICLVASIVGSICMGTYSPCEIFNLFFQQNSFTNAAQDGLRVGKVIFVFIVFLIYIFILCHFVKLRMSILEVCLRIAKLSLTRVSSRAKLPNGPIAKFPELYNPIPVPKTTVSRSVSDITCSCGTKTSPFRTGHSPRLLIRSGSHWRVFWSHSVISRMRFICKLCTIV